MYLVANLIGSNSLGGCRPARPQQRASTTVKTAARQSQEIKLQVLVRDNNVEQALRVLKKKMQREGVFREMKARVLREAFRKTRPRKVRGPSPGAQGGAKAGTARRPATEAEEKTITGGAATRQRPTPSDGDRSSIGAASEERVMMVNLFVTRSTIPARPSNVQPKVSAQTQRRIDEAAAARRKKADSDGTLRRMRQVMEENRLL